MKYSSCLLSLSLTLSLPRTLRKLKLSIELAFSFFVFLSSYLLPHVIFYTTCVVCGCEVCALACVFSSRLLFVALRGFVARLLFTVPLRGCRNYAIMRRFRNRATKPRKEAAKSREEKTQAKAQTSQLHTTQAGTRIPQCPKPTRLELEGVC